MMQSIIKPKAPTGQAPTAPRRREKAPLVERIMRSVKTTATGCWEWQGKVNNSGYGQIGSGGRTGIDLLVHRAMYEHFVGPIPAGLDIDHKCRNRVCCNPSTDHLEAVSRLENLLRGNHPNMVTKRTGVCKRGHQIIGENAIHGADGRTRCRSCTNERKRRYWNSSPTDHEPAIREDKGDYVWRGMTR